MTDLPLMPVRMLVQHLFCRRLFYLEWIDGEFRHNRYTIEGKHLHTKVDVAHEKASVEHDLERVLSIELSSEKEGLIGRVDYIEVVAGRCLPVEIKRGTLPDGGPWFDHKAQVAAYGMLLSDNGHAVHEGILYYAGSRKRVNVPITKGLIDAVRRCVKEARDTAFTDVPPPPLKDSRKCGGCSLSNICLPDEYWAVKEGSPVERRIISARDDSIPLYVQDQGARISRVDERLAVHLGQRKIAEIPLYETSQVCLMGNIQMSTQAVHACMSYEIPILYHTSGGYFKGMTTPVSGRSARVRIHQALASEDPATCLEAASALVAAKIKNQRVFLLRNAQNLEDKVKKDLASLAKRAKTADSPETLLGIEGAAASMYFASFHTLIKVQPEFSFSFSTRNRRPPKDPVNALLSYAYGILVKDCMVALQAAGFEPALGFYHRQRPGRPSLALDLMEPFRAIIADSAVLYSLNNGMVRKADFLIGRHSTVMKPRARRALIQAYEKRMEQLVTHPVFDYRVSYRRILEIEARGLAKYIAGEQKGLVFFTVR